VIWIHAAYGLISYSYFLSVLYQAPRDLTRVILMADDAISKVLQNGQALEQIRAGRMHREGTERKLWTIGTVKSWETGVAVAGYRQVHSHSFTNGLVQT
jgi:hypothetical protein